MAKRLSFEEFDARVQKAYNGKISIIRDTYIDTKHNVTAYCNVHKKCFVKYARDLANGSAQCPECFKELNNMPKNSWETILKRFRDKWGNKYSYDETTYNGYKKEMKVHCNDCNTDFEITPEHHLKYNNGGCPNCRKKRVVKCKFCENDVLVDRRCKKDYQPICDDCKEMLKEQRKNMILKNRKHKYTTNKTKYKKCPFCGEFHELNETCKNELCNRFYSVNCLKKLIPFGFDYSTIGSLKYIEEFNKATKLLLSEYCDNNLSVNSIFIKYNCQEYFKCKDTLLYFIQKKLKYEMNNMSSEVKSDVI